MPSTAYLSDTIRIAVTFRDNGGQLNDPDTVTFSILEYPLAATPVVVLSGSPTSSSTAVYYYDWTPDTVGFFVARFVGTFSDASVDTVDQEFEVLASSDDSQADSTILGVDYILEFAAGLSPLYVSPEELVSIFPDATLLDAAEAIHKASLEVEEILNLSSDEVPVYIALDYVLAQAACILSRTFEFSIDAMSITLGDLSVQNQQYPKNSVNRGNATSPCELAAALRKELLYKTTRSKATVRGSDYQNPIPNRKFIDYSKGRTSEIWYQGRLDDNDGSP